MGSLIDILIDNRKNNTSKENLRNEKVFENFSWLSPLQETWSSFPLNPEGRSEPARSSPARWSFLHSGHQQPPPEHQRLGHAHFRAHALEDPPRSVYVYYVLVKHHFQRRGVCTVSTDPRQVILSVVVGIVIWKNVQDFRVHVNQWLLHREKEKKKKKKKIHSLWWINMRERSVFKQNRVTSGLTLNRLNTTPNWPNSTLNQLNSSWWIICTVREHKWQVIWLRTDLTTLTWLWIESKLTWPRICSESTRLIMMNSACN